MAALAHLLDGVLGGASNTTWQRDLAVSYNKLGDVAVSAGKLDDARDWFDKALTVTKALADKAPSNTDWTDWQRELALSYQRLGGVAMSAGKLVDARTWFDKALAVATTLAAADPINTAWQRDLSISYERLGDVAVYAGKLDDARTWFDKVLAVRKALAAKDPTNAEWQRDLCTTFADLAVAARNASEATQYLAETRTIYDRLQRDGLFQHDVQFAQVGAFLNQRVTRTGSTPKH